MVRAQNPLDLIHDGVPGASKSTDGTKLLGPNNHRSLLHTQRRIESDPDDFPDDQSVGRASQIDLLLYRTFKDRTTLTHEGSVHDVRIDCGQRGQLELVDVGSTRRRFAAAATSLCLSFMCFDKPSR